MNTKQMLLVLFAACLPPGSTFAAEMLLNDSGGDSGVSMAVESSSFDQCKRAIRDSEQSNRGAFIDGPSPERFAWFRACYESEIELKREVQ